MATNPSAISGGLPTGPAGGVLSGTYPNPGLLAGTLITNSGINCQGNLDISTVARGVQVAEGSNAKQGTAVLVAGTVTVANTSTTANSRIFLTAQSLGGTQGILAVTARVAGTSFTITSSNAADTSTVAYEIFEPG